MKKSLCWLMSAIGVVLAALGLYFLKAFPEAQGVMRVLPFLGIGIGCGLFGHGAGELLSRAAVRKHPELAKQIEIEQQDERNVMLANMAKAKGYNMMCYVFSALLLVYSLMGVAFWAILLFVAAYLFVMLYSVYCRIKIEKEQ